MFHFRIKLHSKNDFFHFPASIVNELFYSWKDMVTFLGGFLFNYTDVTHGSSYVFRIIQALRTHIPYPA
jgi:hypothetical protein